MSNLKKVLTKQLNALIAREIDILFEGYHPFDIHLFANDECTELFSLENIVSGELYYDGDGIVQFSVYKISYRDESYLVKFYGTYQSYVGSSYTGWKFVEAKEKMVISYD